MADGCVIVVDIGKTNAKVSLWDSAGTLLARQTRENSQQHVGYRALDVAGIDQWLMESLREFAAKHTVDCIIPVAHGAAAVLLQEGQLFAAPIDYEDSLDTVDRAQYDAQRDSFSLTGSPVLPGGLNLGRQLHYLEQRHGRFPREVVVVPWPQYWAWRLCGVAASEVSSLGCHTDLWQPMRCTFSPLAEQRGWAARMAPVRAAGERLGTITREVADQTALPASCAVLCGLHDSNAALLAARGHREISLADATVLSTGTWFIAMRSVSTESSTASHTLDEARDCLINVDVSGRPVPSARLMGGREAQLIGGIDSFALTENYDPVALLARLPQLIAAGACAYPSFVPGVGPFPHLRGQWRNKPADSGDQRAITGVYLALMADAALELIGSRECLLIEGRFAEAVVFTRALATLRPQQKVFVSNAHQDVAYGALRLVQPLLPPPSELTPVKPLDVDLRAYAAQWRALARTAQSPA